MEKAIALMLDIAAETQIVSLALPLLGVGGVLNFPMDLFIEALNSKID